MVNDPAFVAEWLAGLLGSRAASRPWWMVAEAVDKALIEASDFSCPRDLLRDELQKATGLSWGVLTRYVSTLRRLMAIAEKERLQFEQLLPPGFNAAEAAVRLYDRIPQQGVFCLLELRAGTTSLATVRRLLADAPTGCADGAVAARSGLLRRRASELERLEELLTDRCASLFGRGTTLRPRPPLRYFRHHGLEVHGPDGEVTCGLDLIFPDPAAHKDPLDPALIRSAALAGFFCRFYVVFSPRSGRGIVDRALEELDALGADRVGVIGSSPLRILRRPRGRPDPTRVARYESLKRSLKIAKSKN